MPEVNLYENAPVVEVIAELHWALKPLMGGQGGELDPYFEDFSKDFEKAIAALGWTSPERLVPDEVPRELLGHRVIYRYRPSPNVWPVIQIGPGVLTIHVTPPYGGWSTFKPHISQGIDLLLKSYPLAAKYLKFARFDLRYLDAFTKKHGANSPAAFIRDELGLSPKLPDVLAQYAAESFDEIMTSSEFQVKLKSPVASGLRLKVAKGTAKKEPAAIMEFSLATQTANVPQLPDSILSWFDEAHAAISVWFKSLITPELEKRIGPVKTI